MAASLCPSNRNPVPDTLQVFQGNAAISAFGLRNHRLTDTVIHVTSEPVFLAPPCLQQPLRRWCPFLLELGPQTGMTTTQTVHAFPGMTCPVTVGGNVHDAQVHTQVILDRVFW